MENTETLPLISIIVPVYNVKNYLEKCLQSICGQTYKNLEIILIDDGSSDGSGELCGFICPKGWADKGYPPDECRSECSQKQRFGGSSR